MNSSTALSNAAAGAMASFSAAKPSEALETTTSPARKRRRVQAAGAMNPVGTRCRASRPTSRSALPGSLPTLGGHEPPDCVPAGPSRPVRTGALLKAKHLLRRPLVTLPRCGAKTNEQDLLDGRIASEKLFRFHQRDGRGAIKWKTIRAGADARESDGFDGETCRQLQAVAVTACQEVGFAARTVVPDRTDGLDDPFGRQVIAFSNFRLPGGTTAKGEALFQEPRTGRSVNRPVHSAASEQRGVGRVHNGVDGLAGAVPLDNGNAAAVHEVR